MHLPSIKVVVLVDSKDFANLERYIYDETSEIGRASIELLALDAKRKPRKVWDGLVEENTCAVLELIGGHDVDAVLASANLPIDHARLRELTKVNEFTSLDTLRREISSALRSKGLDWLSSALAEWRKSELTHGTCPPQKWFEQFQRLGLPSVGRNLLKSMRVIENSDLRRAFSIPPSETAGYRVKHAFVKDDEPGSSSQTVRPILEKMHSESIVELNLRDQAQLASLDADVVYVYEDGLWSGVELVKRIDALEEALPQQGGRLMFHFRFAATSDVGLLAARSAARGDLFSTIRISGGDARNHFTFLRSNFDAELIAGKSSAEVRAALDCHVEPLVFRDERLWGKDKALGISACREIGAQLAKPFLERRRAAKMSLAAEGTPNIATPAPITDAKAQEWALGALGFGSTIVFSSSIPKPVIPVMWLGGHVKRDGRSVEWKPLFFDSRRLGCGVDAAV